MGRFAGSVGVSRRLLTGFRNRTPNLNRIAASDYLGELRIRHAQADLIYPVCLTRYKGNEIIIDGVHRLAKRVSEDIETLEVKIISRESFANIAIYA